MSRESYERGKKKGNREKYVGVRDGQYRATHPDVASLRTSHFTGLLLTPLLSSFSFPPLSLSCHLATTHDYQYPLSRSPTYMTK